MLLFKTVCDLSLKYTHTSYTTFKSLKFIFIMRLGWPANVWNIIQFAKCFQKIQNICLFDSKVNCASDFTLFLSLSFRVSDWQYPHSDYLPPLSRNQDLAVSILSGKMFCVVRFEAKKLFCESKGCEGRTEEETLHSISSPLSSLWPSSLRGDRSLHIVRSLHPLPLLEISPTPRPPQCPYCPLKAWPRWQAVYGWMLSQTVQ